MSHFDWIISALTVACGVASAFFHTFFKPTTSPPEDDIRPVDETLPPTPVPAPLTVPESDNEPFDRINACALAQRDFEGWWPGTSSYRNNNPGNLKDLSGNFIRFKSETAGLAALEDYIHRVALGQHKAYPKGGETTIMEYTHIYTSDPEPSPTNYAAHIAKAVGLSTSAPMKALLA